MSEEGIVVNLHNFRKHAQASASFPGSGLIRLSGKNGQGKTTIFNAIVYALYGKLRKPYTRGGKKTAKVELDMAGLHIVRTSRPNRVLVTDRETGTEYEGDAAEGLIRSTLRISHDEFMVSSYIVQLEKNRCSLLSMTPAAQLSVIQTLAFGDSKNTAMKKDIKQLIRTTLDEKIRLEGQLSILRPQITEKESEYPNEPPAPNHDETLEQLNERIEQLKIDIQNLNQHLENEKVELDDLRKQQNDHLQELEKKKLLQHEIESLEKRKMSMTPIISHTSLKEKETNLGLLSEELDIARNYESYLKEKSRYDTLKQEFDEEIQRAIEQAQALLSSDKEIAELEERKVELEEKVVEYEMLKRQYEIEQQQKEDAKKSIAAIFKEIKASNYTSISKRPKEVMDFLSSELSELQTKIGKLKLSRKTKKRLVCPNCQHFVALTMKDELINVASNTPSSKELENVEKELSCLELIAMQLQDWISRLEEQTPHLNISTKLLDDPHQELVDITKKLTKANRTKNDYELLLKKEPPTTLKRLNEGLLDMLSRLPTPIVHNLKECTEAISELTTEIASLTREIDNAKKNRSEQMLIDKEIATKKKSLATLISNHSKSGKTTDLAMTIKKHELNTSKVLAELMDLNQTLSNLQSLESSIREYELWLAHKASIAALEDEINLYEESLKQTLDLLEGAYGLEELCKQAELISIQRTIDNINEHARGYLDDFFEEPMSVRLECGENKVGVVIEYKGETFTDVEEDLSGGERQRCELAFILGINDMVQSPILLLDECLNNIDSEASSDILDVLKDYAVEKPVIVISHECGDGIFDTVVNLDGEHESA